MDDNPVLQDQMQRLNDQAKLAGAYYTELTARGVPDALAAAMVYDWHREIVYYRTDIPPMYTPYVSVVNVSHTETARQVRDELLRLRQGTTTQPWPPPPAGQKP